MQPADRHRERRHAQVGLGLATAGGEPEQVGDRAGWLGAIGMLGIGERRYRQQHERQLERPPTAVLGDVDVLELRVLASPPLERVETAHPLQPHRPVGEAKRFEGLGIGQHRVDARLQSLGGAPTLLQRLSRTGLVLAKRLGIDAILLTADPGRVLLVQDPERLRQRLLVQVGELPHVQYQICQTRQVGRGRCLGHWHVVPGYDLGPNRDGAIDAPGAQLPVHADTVADRELDLVAVEHRQGGSLVVVGSALARRAAAEHVCPVRRTNRELRLEEPRLVLIRLGRLLIVDQEQRHDLLAGRSRWADHATHEDLWLLGIRHQASDFARLRDRASPCRPPRDVSTPASGSPPR